MCMFMNPQFKLILQEPAEMPLAVISFLNANLGDFERSRSIGDDLEIVLCGYSVYHEDYYR
jgi:hypothetical protein